MTTQSPKFTKVQGAFLIELLVTLVVISLSLLGTAHLHSYVMSTRGDSKQRLEALKLLSRKIDDLRQFEVIETQSGKIAFQDIGNNTGGALGSGTYQGYTLSWCVNTNNCNGVLFYGNYYYNGYSSLPTTTAPPGIIIPNFKKVRVIVTWVNNKGATKTIATEIIINARIMADSGIVSNASVVLP